MQFTGQKTEGRFICRVLAVLCGFIGIFSAALASDVKPAPDRQEGEGPFNRLVIRRATLIDGTGAPPFGPVDIVIEQNRIVQIRDSERDSETPVATAPQKSAAARELEAAGAYVLPGLINLHAHAGDVPKAPEATYAYKLWLAHGVTTIRGVPAGNVNWTRHEKQRSAANLITAPRIVAYHVPGDGEDWKADAIETPQQAREWVRWAAARDVEGVKIFNFSPLMMQAVLDEAHKYHMGSVAHITQKMVARVNALDAVRMGLDNLTHFYGLFEAMYENEDIQHWPVDLNYNNEQQRFAQVARQWGKIIPRGKKWQALIDEFLARKFILDPTMTAYEAGRDVMAARNADWHESYTLPSLWDFYKPSRKHHGSYFYDWTLQDEIEWKNFYRVWMMFLNDYKNAGGRVTVSDDAAFIYNLYGFGYVEEMCLLQEAGFHPLEVIRGATLHAAQAIFEPKGQEIQFGLVKPGMLADLLIIDENPLQNLKVLYGTGVVRLNDKTGQPERVGGVKYTIKDGIVYDARQLLKDVAAMVDKQKHERGIERLPRY